MTDTPLPIQVNATATKALLIGLATRALTFAGGLLVAHGLVTQDMVNQAVGPLAQQLVGALITAVGAAWGAWYAQHRQDKLVKMANALPDTIAKVSA